MFVRWQVRRETRILERGQWAPRERVQPGPGGVRVLRTERLVAVLVESERHKGEERPRHRHVAYLGAITEPQDRQAMQRFWAGVLHRLDGLKVGKPERERIETAVSKRVPRPEGRPEAWYQEFLGHWEETVYQCPPTMETWRGERRRRR